MEDIENLNVYMLLKPQIYRSLQWSQYEVILSKKIKKKINTTNTIYNE